MDNIQSFSLDDLGDFDFPQQILTKAEEIQEKHPVKVTTIISADKRKTVKSEFVLSFTNNLKALASLNITARELKVITYILDAMEFGNLFSLNQTAMAKELDLKQPNISLIMKRLKEKGIILDVNGHLYMNSNIFCKGLPHKLSKENNEHLRSAKLETEHFTKSF